MKESFEVLKEAIERVGAKAIASKLNVSTTLVYKWCQKSPEKDSNEVPSGAQNPLDRVRKIYDETQNIELIHWLCAVADGYYVNNAAVDKKLTDSNVLKNIQAFIKEFSEALDVISDSYNKGKRISKTEAKLIRKEWDDLKRIGEGFVRACELGDFDK